MLMVLVLGLPVAVLATATLAGLAFVDVAFRDAGTWPGAAAGDAHTGAGHRARCPSRRAQKILVTPPEALAIVDLVQRTLPAPDVQRIRDVAIANARRARGLSEEQYARAHITCPLLGEAGCCAAYSARPVHCRTWCSRAGHDGERLLDETDGIVQGLNAAGLEGAACEFNSALAVVFQDSQAPARWARGEPVFADCNG